MLSRRPFDQVSTFKYGLEDEAFNLRRQAEGLPAGIRRDELLRKAGQIDAVVEVDESPALPGLLPPT